AYSAAQHDPADGDPGTAAGGILDGDRFAVAAAVGGRCGWRHVGDAGGDESRPPLVQLLRPARTSCRGFGPGALTSGRATRLPHRLSGRRGEPPAPTGYVPMFRGWPRPGEGPS